jgi:hypothetical protein
MNVSADLAKKLNDAGLKWRPTLHDFFVVPDTAVSDRVFVLSDMMAGISVLQGHYAITFNGAVEWALDFVYLLDALWVPTEAQIRTTLVNKLPNNGLTLRLTDDSYQCEIRPAEAPLVFSAPTAADAYGRAMLFLLEQEQ